MIKSPGRPSWLAWPAWHRDPSSFSPFCKGIISFFLTISWFESLEKGAGLVIELTWEIAGRSVLRVYVYVIYIYTIVCMYECMYVSIYLYTYLSIYVCMSVCLYIYIYIYTHREREKEMYILLLNIKNNMAGKCRDILWRVLDGVAHIHQKRRIIIDASAEEKSQWGWVGNIRFLVGKIFVRTIEWICFWTFLYNGKIWEKLGGWNPCSWSKLM